MAIISLTTDWGLRDPYTGALKGALHKTIENIQIIEISHLISPHDLTQASYIFNNAWKSFPDKTIHIIAINSHTDSSNDLLVFEHRDHFFICYDCGLVSLIFESIPENIYRIKSNGQPVTNQLINIAAQICSGIPCSAIGTITNEIKTKLPFMASVDNNSIIGNILYIDEYGNLVTNINSVFFESVRNDRDFTIVLRKTNYQIEKLSAHYNDVSQGELLAYINEAGFLEIAVNQGSAKKLIGLNYGDTFKISFHDNSNSKADHKARSFA